MGDKDVFLFVYENIELDSFKSSIHKVFSAAVRAGFKPKAVGIGKWKGVDNFVALVKSKISPNKDISVGVDGTLAGYGVTMSFGFPFSTYQDLKIDDFKGVLFFVESADKKWLRASHEDKAKLNILLKTLSDKLGLKIEEWGTEYREFKVCRKGLS